MKEFSPDQRLAWIRWRLAEGVHLPPSETLMNSGTRRTVEKREMLRRLRERAEELGQESWPANF